jgi:hypothetical protein
LESAYSVHTVLVQTSRLSVDVHMLTHLLSDSGAGANDIDDERSTLKDGTVTSGGTGTASAMESLT